MESSPPNNSITRQNLPQALPYDFFESPDKHDTAPTNTEAPSPHFITPDPLPPNPFASPEPPPSREESIISLRSVDFTTTTASPRPVTDFTLVEYIIHEMPDLPIFFDRMQQLFRDIWHTLHDTVFGISHTEWRKVRAFVWEVLKGGVVLCCSCCAQAVTALGRLCWSDVTGFLYRKVAVLRSWFGEWAEDMRYRFLVDGSGREYRHF